MLFVSAIVLGISTGQVNYSMTLYEQCCPDADMKRYAGYLRPMMFATGGFAACSIIGVFPRYGIALFILQVGQFFVSFFFRELSYIDRLEVTRLMERTKNVSGLNEKIQETSLLPRSRW
jgi:hypothetical protein